MGDVVDGGPNFFFALSTSASDICVEAFSDASAVVCYSAQGVGTCAIVSVSGNGTLGKGADVPFHPTSVPFFESMVVVSFSENLGTVCYADGTDSNFVACRMVAVDGTLLSVGEEEIVNAEPSTYVTTTYLSESAVLVCYATEVGGNVNGEEFLGLGTCNVLGLTQDNSTVSSGPPMVVNDNPTEHMALASLDNEAAVLCYSDLGAGDGHCRALSLATTTTTTTRTTSTSSTTTSSTTTTTDTSTSESSSTTKHTTTETSTSSETSSTTVHTTTETSTSTETSSTTVTGTETSTHTETAGPGSSPESSKSSRRLPSALLSAGALLAAAAALCA